MQDEKPAKRVAVSRLQSLSLEQMQEKTYSKLNERTGNVYENKGSLWKTLERTGNVYENKALICPIRECY
jgi:hypothetical protein